MGAPYQYVVAGSGLTGSVIARLLTDAGRRVLVLERRPEIGGNVADAVCEGIRFNRFGPHYFRTGSARVWNFMSRFGEFYRYEAHVKAVVDGRHEQWPVAESYIRRVAGAHWAPPKAAGPPAHFEDAVLRRMPLAAYDRFVRQYTEKQWDISPRLLDATLARRVEVRPDGDPRLTGHRYQGLPREGYSTLMTRMLSGIDVELGVDYLAEHDRLRASGGHVFTGGIDEYFGYALGRLRYRGQRRDFLYDRSLMTAQPAAQVNTPQHASGPGHPHDRVETPRRVAGFVPRPGHAGHAGDAALGDRPRLARIPRPRRVEYRALRPLPGHGRHAGPGRDLRTPG